MRDTQVRNGGVVMKRVVWLPVVGLVSVVLVSPAIAKGGGDVQGEPGDRIQESIPLEQAMAGDGQEVPGGMKVDQMRWDHQVDRPAAPVSAAAAAEGGRTTSELQVAAAAPPVEQTGGAARPVRLLDPTVEVGATEARFWGDRDGDGDLDEGERWAIASFNVKDGTRNEQDEALYRKHGTVKIDVRRGGDVTIPKTQFQQLIAGETVTVQGRSITLDTYQVPRFREDQDNALVGQSVKSPKIQGVGPMGYYLAVDPDGQYYYLIYEDARLRRQGDQQAVRVQRFPLNGAPWIPQSVEELGGPSLKAKGLTARQILDALEAGQSVAITSFDSFWTNDNSRPIRALTDGELMALKLRSNYYGTTSAFIQRELGVPAESVWEAMKTVVYQIVDQLDIHYTDSHDEISRTLGVTKTVYPNGLVVRPMALDGYLKPLLLEPNQRLEGLGVAYQYPGAGITVAYGHGKQGGHDIWTQSLQFRDGSVVEAPVLDVVHSFDTGVHSVLYADWSIGQWDADGQELGCSKIGRSG